MFEIHFVQAELLKTYENNQILKYEGCFGFHGAGNAEEIRLHL